MSISLRRSAIIGAASIGAAALVTIATNNSANAQAGEPITVSPPSGEEGTSFTVSGSNCTLGTSVVVDLLNPDGSGFDQEMATPNPVDGSWSVMFTAPDPDDDSYVGQDLGIIAVCHRLTGSEEYAPAAFSVTGPGQNTTTTSSSTTDTTEPPTSDTTEPPTSATTAPPGGGGGGQTTTTAAPGAPTTTAPPAPSGPTPPPANGGPSVPAEPDHTG